MELSLGAEGRFDTDHTYYPASAVETPTTDPVVPDLEADSNTASLDACLNLSRIVIAQALEASKVSVLAKSYLHPISRKLDDFLVRLEIWVFDWASIATSLNSNLPPKLAFGSILTPQLTDIIEVIGGSIRTIQTQIEDIYSIIKRMSQGPVNDR